MRSLTEKVKEMSLLIASGTSCALSKALPYIIEASLSFQLYDVSLNPTTDKTLNPFIRFKTKWNFSYTLDFPPSSDRCPI